MTESSMASGSKSAVDEGRNPYGKPSKGNFDQAWAALLKVPCDVCGSKAKEIKWVNDANNLITINCIGAQHG